MSVEPPITEAEQAEGVAVTPEERIFRYSAWVHVGPGAEGCEAISEDPNEPRNDCSNPLHFHCWCRLPNQFQHEALREKALAAKARRRRQLHNQETDAYEVLEAALDEVASRGDDAKEVIVEELTARMRWQDYADAAREVKDEEVPEEHDEDGDPVLRFGHIEADSARMQELLAMPTEDRPPDEFKELEGQINAYSERVAERYEEIAKPRRDSLLALDVSALVDKLRVERVRREANEHFMSVYHRHEWLVCSYRYPGGVRVFKSFEILDEVAPEVYEALRATFDDLEQSQNLGVESGNS